MGMVLFWIVLILLLLAAEMATTALISVWFVGGGIAALLLAVLHLPIWMQLTAFCGVSILLFVTCKDWLQEHFSARLVPTNSNRLIGAIGSVTQDIDPASGGRVLVSGQDWKAMSIDQKPIAKNELVKVTDIQGVKLIVLHVPRESLEQEQLPKLPD